MRKLIFTGIAGLALIGVASLLLATTASARPAAATPVTIAMHDPGCHWFVRGPATARIWSKTRTVIGPVILRNLDEATLVIKNPAGKIFYDKVGGTLTFILKGIYHIRMVHQAPDDNVLTLTIK